jgi:CheY-like chemotaxis protein
MGWEQPYILVVDDQHDTADSMATLLCLWGYDGEAHYSGAAALMAASIRQPIVVLLDLEMPEMNGFQFVAHLRELPGCEQTAITAVSGHTSASCLARARNLGIGYLFKPVDLGQLQILLNRLIVNHELSNDRHEPHLRMNSRAAELAVC